MLGYFFEKEKILWFENILRQNNYNKGFNIFLKECTAIGTAFFVLGIVVLFAVKADVLYLSFFPFIFFAAGFLLYFFVQFYMFDFRRNLIEKFVPDILLSASIFPSGTNLEKIIAHFSRTNYRFLSEEFEKCQQEILKGSSAVDALSNMKKRNDSVVLNRAIDLIISGVNSGSDVAQVFKETAQDLLETASILRERVASTTIEKYTLLVAGGIIVPAILGILVGIVSDLEFGALGELGIGLSAAQRDELVSAAVFASPVYLVEYAFIASFFVAFTQKDLKKGIIYSVVLVPLSLAVYFIVPAFF